MSLRLLPLRLLSLRLPFKGFTYRHASVIQLQRIWGGVSRLEIILERSQNRCELSRIISYQNCHLLLCSLLSPYSQSLLDVSSQDARTAYVRNCHQGLRGSLCGSLRIWFSLFLCSNSICHVLGFNAYIVRPFGHSS